MQVRAIRYFVKQMIAKHRVPVPAIIAEADTRLEYTTVEVNDTRALLAPAENRLGRLMGDVHSSETMEQYLKALHTAKRKQRPQSDEMTYNGRRWRVTAHPPTNGRIVTTVTAVEHGQSR